MEYAHGWSKYMEVVMITQNKLYKYGSILLQAEPYSSCISGIWRVSGHNMHVCTLVQKTPSQCMRKSNHTKAKLDCHVMPFLLTSKEPKTPLQPTKLVNVEEV